MDFYRFLEGSAGVLGISCMSDLLPLALITAEMVKVQDPKKTIILGGAGPTGAAEKILENFPFIDIVVKGEGEKTIVELMEYLRYNRDLGGVRGISYRKEAGIYHNPPREWIAEIDTIAFPAYDKIDLNRYTVPGILTSRGCPYECAFCDVSPFWGSANRRRGIGDITREIRLLNEKYGKEYIDIFDDTFTAGRRRILDFCKVMREEQLDISWSCCGRVDCMDEELMKEMAESGCAMVAYGVESGADRVLTKMKKGFTRREAMDILSRSTRYFDVIAYLMWGFPFETISDFQATINLICDAVALGVKPWLFSLAPLPLSSIYKQNRHRLQYLGEFCSNYLGLLQEPNIVRLIKKHPDIFPGFYHCDPLFEKKYVMAKKLGLTGTPIITGPEGASNE